MLFLASRLQHVCTQLGGVVARLQSPALDQDRRRLRPCDAQLGVRFGGNALLGFVSALNPLALAIKIPDFYFRFRRRHIFASFAHR